MNEKIDKSKDSIVNNSLIDHVYTPFVYNINLNSTPDHNKKTDDKFSKVDPIKQESGYYGSADPEIDLHLQKPKNSKPRRKSVLQNSNTQKPRPINGKKISFVNTCPFDCIVEILSRTMCNVQNFKDFVISNKTETKSAKYECFADMLSMLCKDRITLFILTEDVYYCQCWVQKIKSIHHPPSVVK